MLLKYQSVCLKWNLKVTPNYTTIIMKLFLLICFCCIVQLQVSSQSKLIVRSTTGVSGTSDIIIKGDETFEIQQSFGQSSPIGTYSVDDYTIRQGFIQPNVLAKIMDQDIPLNLNASVYPNPFIEKISMSFNEDVKGAVEVFLYDMSGREIYNHKFPGNNSFTINLGELPVANYILKARVNDKQIIKKLIKK